MLGLKGLETIKVKLLRRDVLFIGLRGAIAQGHHKIGGTKLADCRMDILVAYVIFLKGTYICDPITLINLTV